MAGGINSQIFSLPSELTKQVEAALDEWTANNKVERLWQHHASLWTGEDEDKWLGWLSLVGEQKQTIRRFTNFAAEVRDAGFSRILLLGMGGSSLCPEVLRKSFGKTAGFPELHVLDSTDPAQIKSFENKIDVGNTLFVVSSKSGTTLEPNIFKQYFFERARQVVGPDEAGRRFVAVTDPGSKLRQAAEDDHFRKIFLGVPSVGGRYSAFTDFGLAPACAMGIDVERFLDHAATMVIACELPPKDNPGVILGALLGVAHNSGRDKVTIIASPGIYDLGAWLEQLLAESTGKNGKGLIPVDREKLAPTAAYTEDRVFVSLKLDSDGRTDNDDAIEAIQAAGHPVVRIVLPDVYDLGQEFFRWEIATAVAGSIIGINPFNQPDVEASKVATRKLTESYEETGSLPEEKPFFAGDGLKLFADERNAAALRQSAGELSLKGYLRAHLDRVQPHDYVAILAYLEMNEANEATLQAARYAVSDRKRVATCLGFGPRFLHSTGQAYKGGPNSGVFLQITCDDAEDFVVPGQTYTFGTVKAAQARGDFEVLAERGRRALRVHLGADVAEGLAKLSAELRSALG